MTTVAREPDAAPTLDAAEVRARVLTEVTARRTEIAEALAQARADLAALVAESERIYAEHAAACDEARARHLALPPAPTVPDSAPVQDLVHRLQWLGQDVNDDERSALASAVPEITQAWSEARPHLDALAAEVLAATEALADRYRGWWDLVRAALRAAETADPNVRPTAGPSTRMRARPDALSVLAAGHGADLCAVQPVSGLDVLGQRVAAGRGTR